MRVERPDVDGLVSRTTIESTFWFQRMRSGDRRFGRVDLDRTFPEITPALCQSLSRVPKPSRKDHGYWYFSAHPPFRRPMQRPPDRLTKLQPWLNLSPITPAMPGRVRSRDAGAYKGRKRTVTADEVRALRDLGFGPSAITRKLVAGDPRCSARSARRPSPRAGYLPQQRFRCNAVNYRGSIERDKLTQPHISGLAHLVRPAPGVW
jgi:hypothetical protein